MANNTSYLIAQLAKEFNVTYRLLRYYEQQEILKPKRIKKTRLYSPKDRIRLQITLRARRIGISLKDCKVLYDFYDNHSHDHHQLSNYCALLTQHKNTLLIQKKEIQETIQELDAALEIVNKQVPNQIAQSNNK